MKVTAVVDSCYGDLIIHLLIAHILYPLIHTYEVPIIMNIFDWSPKVHYSENIIIYSTFL